VTNIALTFTSVLGLSFATNDFWRGSGASRQMIWHLDSLPVGRAIKIPSIIFSETNLGLVGICINAPDMQQQLIGFWMIFSTTNSLSKPLILPVTPSFIASTNGSFISLMQHMIPDGSWRGIPIW
jgi:hypothetical protein